MSETVGNIIGVLALVVSAYLIGRADGREAEAVSEPQALEIPCDCCGGQPDECQCKWGDATIYEPDGTPTSNTEEYCYAHHERRPLLCGNCYGKPERDGAAYCDRCEDYLDGSQDKASW